MSGRVLPSEPDAAADDAAEDVAPFPGVSGTSAGGGFPSGTSAGGGFAVSGSSSGGITGSLPSSSGSSSGCTGGSSSGCVSILYDADMNDTIEGLDTGPDQDSATTGDGGDGAPEASDP
jgi:hypothetical protein